MTDDEKISRRYRELPREEPPRHLDDAILAASRRAVHTRPAPLVVPTGRQRWYFPVAAAAIIVLAVAVTMHVEREQPAEEIVSSAPQPSAPAAAAPAARESMREEAKLQAEKAKPVPQAERRRKAESADSRQSRDQLRDAPPELQKAPQPAAAPAPPPAQEAMVLEQNAAGALMGRVETPKPLPAPAPEAKPSGRVKAVTERRFDEGARATSSLSAYAAQSPEQWLQGIADLRKQGRHEEADKELAEFRRRHPDYKIPPTMRERVERR